MTRMARRIAPFTGVCSIAMAGCFAFTCPQAFAQGSGDATAPKTAPASYSGCVQKAPNSSTDLIISTPTACARLTGNVSADQLAGHQVELTGIFTPRSSSAPASIQVNSVSTVGKSCTETCALKPPGTRGLHRPDGAVPGSEGGTPGAAPKPPQ